MLDIPNRNSLITQTVEILRRGMSSDEWGDFLPGERVLCDHLQISRPTLRVALSVLQREGLIETSHGKRRRIIGSDHGANVGKSVVLGLVTANPPHLLSPLAIFYISELRKHLQEAGLRLQVFTDRKIATRNPGKFLENLVREKEIACWILLVANESVQRWFADQQLPTLVAGSSYHGVELPSLDLDWPAVCRHAAGLFLRHGHRRIACLVPDSGIAGDRDSEEHFLLMIRTTGGPEAEGIILRHDGSKEDIARKIDRMLKTAQPPTGLLVCKALHALTVMTFLMNRGLSIPKDISVLSRDSDNYLDFVEPELSRYSYQRRHFATRLSRLAIQLATTGNLPVRQNRLIPRLIPGKTVGPPPSEKA